MVASLYDRSESIASFYCLLCFVFRIALDIGCSRLRAFHTWSCLGSKTSEASLFLINLLRIQIGCSKSRAIHTWSCFGFIELCCCLELLLRLYSLSEWLGCHLCCPDLLGCDLDSSDWLGYDLGSSDFVRACFIHSPNC